jgi:Mn2+/Fe2+ NRAMP family transporter
MSDHVKKVPRKLGLLAVIGPGLLVAATGVGAGDLAVAALTGAEVGTVVLWAVVLGAFMKYVLTEGLARWQLATDTTLIEGTVTKLGGPAAWIFLPYLFLWSFLVSMALMGACGVTMHAIAPVFDDASRAKIVFGIAHSVLGLVLVLLGGFRLFEKVMSVCIGVMFGTVVLTAVFLWPGTGDVLRGLFLPPRETFSGTSLTSTVALMGGVGGTVTVLCYGYWIREKGRAGERDLGICRIDLGLGYLMTAVFGLAMVIIGSKVPAEGSGAKLIVNLSGELQNTPLGVPGKWVFLLGGWGAVFSSLLGVWQAIPYLFTDFWNQIRGREQNKSDASDAPAVDTKSFAYRLYLVAIAIVPIIGLVAIDFKKVIKVYAVTGALFIPLLALLLLILNGRRAWVGDRFRNRWPTIFVLVGTVAFFAWFLWTKTAAPPQ